MIKIIYDDERGYKEYQNIKELIFENLVSRRFDYNEITKMYVEYLQEQEYKHKRQLSEIDMPLIETYEKSKHLSIKNTKDCIVRYLVKYNRFKNAPINEELIKYAKDNNLNLDGFCYNDIYKGDD